MPESNDTTSLNIHTLDSFCIELVSGRGVSIDGRSDAFRFRSDDTRAVFGWLMANRQYWPQLNRSAHVEQMVQALDSVPAARVSEVIAAAPAAGRTLHLARVRANRFAGLHQFGTFQEPPPVFDWQVPAGITLLQGDNGAGKSSILSAIVWALSGKILRSQRSPEAVNVAVPIRADQARAIDAADIEQPAQTMTSITPMPPGSVLNAVGFGPHLVDTWVELTFLSSTSQQQYVVRRSFERVGRSLREIVVGLTDLGVDPISLSVSTIMPAQVPYIQLGSASTMGAAVSALTGFRALSDLVNYVRKSIDKLQSDLPRDRRAELGTYVARWTSEVATFRDITQGIAGVALPSFGDCQSPDEPERELDIAQVALEECISTLLRSAQTLLGTTFDPSIRESAERLRASVPSAIGGLQSAQLLRIHSFARSQRIRALTSQQAESMHAVVSAILQEAEDFGVLIQNAATVPRIQLYAAVASWLARHVGSSNPNDCPVCDSDLTGKVDNVTSRPVSAHIAEQLAGNRSYLALPINQWVRDACRRMLESIPPQLQSELAQDLPASPGELFREGVNELFEGQDYQHELGLLKTSVVEAVDRAVRGLPQYDDVPPVVLPVEISAASTEVEQKAHRLLRLVAFSRWRQSHETEWRRAVISTIGNFGGIQQPQDPIAVAEADSHAPNTSQSVPSSESSLGEKLNQLDAVIRTAAPARSAIDKLVAMRRHLIDIRATQLRITNYSRAVTALEPILGLQQVVANQVDALMSRLGDRTAEWKAKLYQGAFEGAPRLKNADVGSRGELVVEAVREDAVAPAEHVSNASDLRGSLLAFVIALWEEVVRTRGGLSLLVLDDINDLFDERNQRRLAGVMPNLFELGARPLITTNQRKMRTSVLAACRIDNVRNIECLAIHPLSANRKVVRLGPFVETVETKKAVFQADRNSTEAARDYVNALRIYLEQNLLDFFRTNDPGLGDNPTLSVLISALRGLNSSGVACFSDPPFQSLLRLSALRDNSDFLTVLNRSHHGEVDLIGYTDVQGILSDCERVCESVRLSHDHFERWMRRDRLAGSPATSVPPAALSLPSRNIPIYRVAAVAQAEASSAGDNENEFVNSASFANHAIFHLNTDNCGLCAARNARVLVELTQGPLPVNQLVVAIHGGTTMVRRLLRDPSKPHMAVLASETTELSRRPPAKVCPLHELQVFRIVGVLLGPFGAPVDRSGEATLVTEMSNLTEVKVLFRVEQDSAVPFARPDQFLLGVRRIVPTELASHVGKLAVVKAGDDAVFKRIGHGLPGCSHVRVLESIGAAGSSVVVRTEGLESDPFQRIPLASDSYLIAGVLYALPSGAQSETAGSNHRDQPHDDL